MHVAAFKVVTFDNDVSVQDTSLISPGALPLSGPEGIELTVEHTNVYDLSILILPLRHLEAHFACFVGAHLECVHFFDE